MALIHCKHCGNAVSDRATTCPHCGHHPQEADTTTAQPHSSVEESATQKPSSSSTNKLLVAIVIVLILIVAGLGGYLLFGHGGNSADKQNLADSVMTDSASVDTTRCDTLAEEKEVELKYTTPTDLVRMNLKGKVKSIHLYRDNPSEDPMGNGHGEYDWLYKFDRQGMLLSMSNEETAYIPQPGTIYYTEGKVSKRVIASNPDNKYRYKYKQISDHTVNVTEVSPEGEERLAMTLTFYDNGNLKEKSILVSDLDPFAYLSSEEEEKAYVVKYNSEGIEIDNKSSRGKLTSEKKDAKGNWTVRSYASGESFTREIKYY